MPPARYQTVLELLCEAELLLEEVLVELEELLVLTELRLELEELLVLTELLDLLEEVLVLTELLELLEEVLVLTELLELEELSDGVAHFAWRYSLSAARSALPTVPL